MKSGKHWSKEHRTKFMATMACKRKNFTTGDHGFGIENETVQKVVITCNHCLDRAEYLKADFLRMIE